jgi:hypothetical protein
LNGPAPQNPVASALERAIASGGGSKDNDTGAGLIDLLR